MQNACVHSAFVINFILHLIDSEYLIEVNVHEIRV